MTQQNPKQPPPNPSEVFEQDCDDFLLNVVRPWLHNDLKKKGRTMPMPMRLLYGRRSSNQELWEQGSEVLGLIKDDTLQDADHEIAVQTALKNHIIQSIYRCVYTPNSDKLLQNPDDVYVAVVRQVPPPQSSMQRLEEFASTSNTSKDGTTPRANDDTPTSLPTKG